MKRFLYWLRKTIKKDKQCKCFCLTCRFYQMCKLEPSVRKLSRKRFKKNGLRTDFYSIDEVHEYGKGDFLYKEHYHTGRCKIPDENKIHIKEGNV